MSQEHTPEPDVHDELREEYDFDYRRAQPNRFAQARKQADGSLVVVLDPDVARVFTTPEAVNGILRVLIQHMPEYPKNAT